jgi:hypothetical protein
MIKIAISCNTEIDKKARITEGLTKYEIYYKPERIIETFTSLRRALPFARICHV